MAATADKPLVFISYAHAVAAEAELARTLAERLPEGGCRIFLDREIAVGATWDDDVAEALATCDAFVVLLSAASLASPMVCEEIVRIGERRRRAPGFPKLLPVHVGSIGMMPYRIAGYLNEVQYTKWNGDADTTGLIDMLRDRLRDLVEHRGKLPSLCTLPGRTLDFIGRQKELNELCAALVGGGRATISALGGMGGVGKTTLAIEAAWRVAPMFPDGVLYLSLGGIGGEFLAPQQVIARIVERIEPTAKLPNDLSRLQDNYRSLLTGRRMLVLLDNARDTTQVEDLVPPEPVALLVTSREPIHLFGVQPVELGELPEAEALVLLRSSLHGRPVSGADLASIAITCTRLPIALRAAGAFLAERRNWSIADYLAALEQSRLRHLRSRQAKKLDVAAVLRLSVERLAAEQPALTSRWRLLSVFPGDFATDAAAAVWSCETKEAGEELDELTTRSLLLHDVASRRWRLHDLYRELATNGADEKGLEAACERHAQYYCSLLRRARDQLRMGGTDAVDGLTVFDRERINIETSQHWASSRRVDQPSCAYLTFQICDAGGPILFLRLPPKELIAWLRDAVAACRQLKMIKEEYYSLGNLSVAEATAGETWLAIFHLEQVLRLAESFNEQKAIALTIMNLGARWNELGPFMEFQFHSLYLYSTAFEIFDSIISDSEIDNKDLLRNKAHIVMNIGNALSALNLELDALHYLEHSLNLYVELGDEWGEANTLRNIAYSLARANSPAKANQAGLRALGLCRRLKHPGTIILEQWLRERGINLDTP